MEQIKPSADAFDLDAADWMTGATDQAIADPVQIAFCGESILMRSGAGEGSPVLVFTQAEWDAFVAGVLDGEFDYED
ncbi:DUF397 domain-containing protein [Planomonospora venezuelensis]|uniref:DUF397 domain-containing protein n=1 Tax=Planomonospora venezuelensis TaxID=1999 RepID=A0A841D0C2_PLAVE|nr:DUF397 domain-containing protein [Planomonospora venezuelensis]MBB5961974.1 hypothetical protein [Planomonospora venezuelensis]GIN00074.1 hypothetical protein Pve01_17320 [Planomonospora venezuelensis]